MQMKLFIVIGVFVLVTHLRVWRGVISYTSLHIWPALDGGKKTPPQTSYNVHNQSSRHGCSLFEYTSHISGQ